MHDVVEDISSPSPPQASPKVRSLVIGTIGFLTLVDLFAAQAILPRLGTEYHVSPSEIGLAVNASTLGMAVAGPLTALVVRGVSRRSGIWISLALLAVPTGLLAYAPTLAGFGLLRVLQGILMASAFTLTLAHFAERCNAHQMPRALAAYITGSVMANLLGRVVALHVAELFGLPATFLVLALLNATGALLAYLALTHVAPLPLLPRRRDLLRAFALHLRNPALARAYGLGFLVLFAFVGLFSYVGFALVAPEVGLSMRSVGLVFLCFLPSLATTPLVGPLGARFGSAQVAAVALSCAIVGALLSLHTDARAIFVGLALFASGTFVAQAVATSYVGRVATFERASASGLYLSAYYTGGLVAAVVIGLVYERFGWSLAVAAVVLALATAAVLATRLTDTATE
jgi:predicted MFS family arabinose efflux permease